MGHEVGLYLDLDEIRRPSPMMIFIIIGYLFNYTFWIYLFIYLIILFRFIY